MLEAMTTTFDPQALRLQLCVLVSCLTCTSGGGVGFERKFRGFVMGCTLPVRDAPAADEPRRVGSAWLGDDERTARTVFGCASQPRSTQTCPTSHAAPHTRRSSGCDTCVLILCIGLQRRLVTKAIA